jgi:hypothetical protein
MLDGQRYYETFPDEEAARPKILVSHELLDALAALEKEFRQQIEQFRRTAALPGAPEANEETS